jgi:translation initiation factor 2B subunit (eIF-2B alpha/beta/delta family)
MNVQFDEIWRRLETDRSRGSTELALNTLESVGMALKECSSISYEKCQKIAHKLQEIRPEMTLIVNLGHLLDFRLEESPNLPYQKHVLGILDDLRDQLRQSQKDIRQALDDLPFEMNKAVIFSRSGVIRNLVESLGMLTEITVLESHPGSEGIDLANHLSDDLPITFAYDVEAPSAIDDSNVLFLGADSFDDSGAVLNKTGSSLIARASGTTPVVVCFQTLKYGELDPSDSPTVPSPETVDSTLRRDHSIFEAVSPGLIDYYATDVGLFEKSGPLNEQIAEIIQAYSGVDPRQ